MREEETIEKSKRKEAAHSGGKKEIEREEPDVEGVDDDIPVILPNRRNRKDGSLIPVECRIHVTRRMQKRNPP